MPSEANQPVDTEIGETQAAVRGAGTVAGRVVFWVGVAVSLAHLYFNTFGTLPELWTSAIHFGAFGFLCALLFPIAQRGGLVAQKAFAVVDLALGLLAVACVAYLILNEQALYERGATFILSDWVFGLIGVVLAIEFARRTTGWLIPAIIVLTLLYLVWWGRLVGGVFNFPGLSVENVLFRMFYGTDGMFGTIARISSTYVFMFILFGAFLVRSGAGDFIIDLARTVAGRLVGGPGLVAVLGSGLMGSISGSAVANTVSTGIITIPLMKRAGFTSRFAAGVEAAASTGGQLMPPVMGAGAFIMSSYTEIPYLTIIAVAALPAVMYFLSVAFWVRIEAKRLGMEPSIDEDVPSIGQVLRRGGHSLIPIAVLIALLIYGYTPTYAAGFSILAAVAASWLSPNRMGPRAIVQALALGARNMVSVAVLLVAVGIIVNAVGTAGVGNTFSLMITDWAGGNLFVTIILVALASLVLGMGLPVTAAYIVLGTLSAPALSALIVDGHLIEAIASGQVPEAARTVFMLVSPESTAALNAPMSETDAARLAALIPPEMRGMVVGQTLDAAVLTTAVLSAHMIIFWLSQDSNVTPPVCLTAFAAAAIAKSPPMATGLMAWKIAKGLYIVPLLFAYTPFLSGDIVGAVVIFTFGTLGIYCLTAAVQGYAEWPLNWGFRIVFAGLGVVLLWPLSFLWHAAAALGVVAGLGGCHVLYRRSHPLAA
ncbi:MAG: TRAP transporter fused permease subunit [Hyphomicrobiales bacterium]|nr:TRAP transporter fused permease subunit [Hyphomicrobiales bacterium]